jgi:hypothetical protein
MALAGSCEGTLQRTVNGSSIFCRSASVGSLFQ